MTETQKQVLIRLGRLALEGIIAFLIVHLPELVNLIELDPTLKAILIPALMALLDAIAKAIGGATQPMLAVRGRRAAAAERPSWLSV